MKSNAAILLPVDEHNKCSDTSLEQFNELMKEVAELPIETRSIVSVYSQGVLAMANMQKKEKAGIESKYQQMSLF